jgi:hypothetical protein
MTSNIKLNERGKSDLVAMKKAFGCSTYSNVIEIVYSFFTRNKITPRDNIDSNFFAVLSMLKEEVLKEVLDIKKFVKTDSQSMRKLLRALEKDHLVKLSTKVSFLTDEAKERNLKINVEDAFNISKENTKNKDLIKNENSDLELINQQAKIISTQQKTLQKQDISIEKNELILKKIQTFYKVEKNTFGKEKVVIEIEREEFENLFNL